MDAFLARLAPGGEQARRAFALGVGWLQEANSGLFPSWDDDLAFLRANWDGPIVLKSIQTVDDAHGCDERPHGRSSSCRTTVRVQGTEQASA